MSFNKLSSTIGIDPGLNGAVGILIGNQAVVNDCPIIKSKTEKISRKGQDKGKKKTTYHRELDPQGMFDLLKPFAGQDVVVALEKVGVMASDGKASMFSFGEGIGFWKMATVANGLTLVEVRPQEWKKAYPQLESAAVSDHRESIKALKAKQKMIKDKAEKKRITKEIKTLNRQLKAAAKDAARELAMEMWPDIADSFELKKHDGRAESLLIAEYARVNSLGRS